MGKQRTRRGLPAILACALALLLCALSPQSAKADDAGRITGTCKVTEAGYTTGVGFHCKVTMPDGTVLDGECWERHQGVVDHENYPGPCNGTYPFTATWNSETGAYEVVVDSTRAQMSYNGYQPVGNYTFQHVFVARWTPQVSVTFTKCSADATVTSGNSEYAYAGAGYDIYLEDGDQYVCHVTTDGNGHASYKLDANQYYYAVETDAPQGFVKSNERHYFKTGNSAGGEQLEDDPGYVIFTLAKKDAATLGEAQPGATLAGAEYRVDSLSTPGWSTTVTTNDKGVARVSRIPIGKVVVTETKAPKGYRLDPTPHTYEVHADQITNAGTIELTPEDDFRESVVAFDLEIAKTAGTSGAWDTSDGQARPCAGVQFQVISNTTSEVVGTLTTNGRGFASTRDAATCEAASRGGERSDDASRPWFGKGKRTSAINGAIRPSSPATKS